jgi:hypothetical protein
MIGKPRRERMKYVLIADLVEPEEFDDALYTVRTRVTPDANDEPTYELFSENDLYVIDKRKPEEADALALTDDWVFWDTKRNKFLGYVFKY